ncbi:MAG: HEAT repeat domain-containing protein [bacterium]
MRLARELIVVVYYTILLYYLAINTINFAVMVVSFITARLRARRLRFIDLDELIRSNMLIPVSILVPAYNEELVIVDSVNSLLKLKYPEFEVVVINDGSKDDTLQVLIDTFDLRRADLPFNRAIPTEPIRGFYINPEIPNLVVVDKENGGKDDALNVGINVSRHPLFCSVDADTILEENAMIYATLPFLEDEDTVATGGHVRLRNGCRIERSEIVEVDTPRSFLPMMQIVEYARSFVMGRIWWNTLNALLIISGAFGVFKKDAVIEVGGYQPRAIGEDMELVVHLHEHLRRNGRRGKFFYVSEAVCWTEAPDRLRGLGRQRTRWHQGLLTSLRLYKHMIFNPKYGVVGLVAMPYFLIFELLTPIMEVIGVILLVTLAAMGVLKARYFYNFAVVTVIYGTFLSMAAVIMDRMIYHTYPKLRHFGKMLLFAALENFGYHHLNVWWRLKAFWVFYFKEHFRQAGWSSPQRIGTGAKVPPKERRITPPPAYGVEDQPIALFLKALSDPEWSVRNLAAKKIVKILGEKSIELVDRVLKSKGASNLRDHIEALVEMGKERVRDAVELLHSQNAGDRQYAALILGEAMAEDCVEVLASSLLDEDEGVRYFAIESLGKIGSRKAISPLISILKEDDVKTKFFAITALGKIGDVEAIFPLAAFLEDDLMRQVVIEALGDIGGSMAEEVLRSIEEMGGEEAKAAVLRSIRKMKTLSTPNGSLWGRMRRSVDLNPTAPWDGGADPYSRRWRAIRNLIRFGDPGVVNSLSRLVKSSLGADEIALLDRINEIWEEAISANSDGLRSQNKNVRALSGWLLGEMGDSRAVNDLIANLADESEPEVAYYTAEALGKIGDSSAQRPLLDALGNRKERGVRYFIAEALGNLGQLEDATPLLKALEDDFLAPVALESLGNVGNKTSLEALVSLMLRTEDEYIDRMAHRAITRIIDRTVKRNSYNASGSSKS